MIPRVPFTLWGETLSNRRIPRLALEYQIRAGCEGMPIACDQSAAFKAQVSCVLRTVTSSYPSSLDDLHARAAVILAIVVWVSTCHGISLTNLTARAQAWAVGWIKSNSCWLSVRCVLRTLTSSKPSSLDDPHPHPAPPQDRTQGLPIWIPTIL